MIKAFSLFCGAGGIYIGADLASFKDTKIRTLLSLDIWQDACDSLKTYYKNSNNHKAKVIAEDITKINDPINFWQNHTKTEVPDLIYGGGHHVGLLVRQESKKV